MTLTKFSIFYLTLSLFASLRPHTLSTSLLPVAHAYALPEPPKGHARRDWDNAPCTDTVSTTTGIATNQVLPTASIAEEANSTQLAPVTVTITIITAANTTFTLPPPTATSHSTRTNTTSTVVPTSTQSVNPLVASAQEAQRLNAEWASLNANDACTPGERACIASALAECSPNSKWVRSICVIGSDPNVSNVCAAIPTNSNSTATSTSTSLIATTTATTSGPITVSESNGTPPVQLGCFAPDQISQLFNAAGVQGGMFPPGFQTSGAEGRRVLGGISLVGGALIALLVL